MSAAADTAPAAVTATRAGDFARVPPQYARYVIDAATAGRMLGVEADQVPAVAGDALPSAPGPLFDYVDLINLALFGKAGEQGIPGLALRFLLRFASSEPPTWYAPRNWLVRVRTPQPAAGATARATAAPALSPPDLTSPGVTAVDLTTVDSAALARGTVDPPGYTVAVRLTGDEAVVRDRTANRIFDEMLAALLSGEVVYQAVTERLRMRHREAWRLGMADCVVVSRLLAARLRAAGRPARARRGYLLGLVGSDHAWCEIHDDGQWRPLDLVFAFLASGGSGTRRIEAGPGFVEACRGGRFNRLLPCATAEASAVITLGGRPAPPWWTSAVSATPWEP